MCYTDFNFIFCWTSLNASILNIYYLNKVFYYIRAQEGFCRISLKWQHSLFQRHSNAPLVKTKYQRSSAEAHHPKMGLMQWRIKGVYLAPQSLPFVSSWFVLMWEPNPAKADYTCIKFLKIAVFLIPHLQWKCNGSSLQNLNLPNCVSAAIKGLRRASKMRRAYDVFKKILLHWWCFLVRKYEEIAPPPRREKKVIAKTADMGYKLVCVCDWSFTVTQIVALKNKKVFRLYLCYFTKSI